MRTIPKIYLSNFLTGLVFWYSIEKLFMRGIGLGAEAIGILTAVVIVTTLLLDIPSGILADRWSRRGILSVAIVALAISSVLAGAADGLGLYLVAAVCYGVYLVGTSGTYQALMYDTLHEENRADQYSRIMGRAYALFLVGAAVANVAGGVWAEAGGSLRWAFFLTVIPCALNVLVLVSIREPRYHKATERGRLLRDLGSSLRVIGRIAVLRSLVLVWMALTVAEVFKQDFSQLYALAFTQSALVVALFWAVYALLWALGSYVAHYLQRFLGPVLVVSAGLVVALGLVRGAWGIGLFLLQVVVAAAMVNLIETRIQAEVSSAVRASILSVVSTLNRLVQLPAALVLGWLISRYDVFAGLQLIAAVAAVALLYWWLVGRRRLGREQSRVEPGLVSRPMGPAGGGGEL